MYKATPNKFPVSRPPPASILSEHQKSPLFPYSFIISVFSCILRHLKWREVALVNVSVYYNAPCSPDL